MNITFILFPHLWIWVSLQRSCGLSILFLGTEHMMVKIVSCTETRNTSLSLRYKVEPLFCFKYNELVVQISSCSVGQASTDGCSCTKSSRSDYTCGKIGWELRIPQGLFHLSLANDKDKSWLTHKGKTRENYSNWGQNGLSYSCSFFERQGTTIDPNMLNVFVFK